MNRLFRFWNQNRYALIIGIVAIALLIIFIHILNGIIHDELNNTNEVELTQAEKELPTSSVIGGESVSIETSKINVDIINSFVDKCNSGDVSGAYAMITDECKEALYPTEDMFKSGYYSRIFTTKRVAELQNFLSRDRRYTYVVTYNEDLLSTGSVQNDSAYQDYITTYEGVNENKISISSFIYRRDINQETEIDGVKIIAVSEDVFRDREEYKIRVENTSGKTISIVGNNTNSVYLIDTNNVKYNSNIVEVATTSYQIPSFMSRTYNLKFKKLYSSGTTSDKIAFLDIVTDYELFKQAPDQIPGRMSLSVEV